MSLLSHRGQPIVVGDGKLPSEASAEPARLLETEMGLIYSYRCPLHDTQLTEPYAPGFARRYLAARADGTCCCPLTAPWSVRHGLSSMRLLPGLLLVLWIANICDLVLTIRAVALGRATEVNGVMGYFLRSSSLAAALFKIGIVTAAVLLLWLLRRRRVVLAVAVVLAIIFVALVCYEVLSLASG